MQSLRDLIRGPRTPNERFSQESAADFEVVNQEPLLEGSGPDFPVPPSFPSGRETPFKSHRIFFTTGTTTTAPLAGSFANPTAGEVQVEFGIQSIIAQNLTSQWVYCVDIDQFIPPQTWNAVMRGNGSPRMRAIFETPPGIAASPIQSATERCVMFLSNEFIPVTGGVSARTIATT